MSFARHTLPIPWRQRLLMTALLALSCVVELPPLPRPPLRRYSL